MEAMTSESPIPIPRKCPACKAFMAARARSCGRCRAAAREAERRVKTQAQVVQRAQERAVRAVQELTRLRDKAKKDAWRLPRLQQAIEGRRRSSQLGPEEWEPIVHAVFGAPADAIVDPRQMSLFGG